MVVTGEKVVVDTAERDKWFAERLIERQGAYASALNRGDRLVALIDATNAAAAPPPPPKWWQRLGRR